jgi:hypothetical protein
MFVGKALIPVKSDDCNVCHKQSTEVVIPNGERVKDDSEKLSVWQQIQHQNLEAEFYLYRYMYFTHC